MFGTPDHEMPEVLPNHCDNINKPAPPSPRPFPTQGLWSAVLPYVENQCLVCIAEARVLGHCDWLNLDHQPSPVVEIGMDRALCLATPSVIKQESFPRGNISRFLLPDGMLCKDQ